MAILASFLMSAALKYERRAHEVIMLVPPAETNGNVTPVRGRRSTAPKTFSIVWKINIVAAPHAPMV